MIGNEAEGIGVLLVEQAVSLPNVQSRASIMIGSGGKFFRRLGAALVMSVYFFQPQPATSHLPSSIRNATTTIVNFIGHLRNDCGRFRTIPGYRYDPSEKPTTTAHP